MTEPHPLRCETCMNYKPIQNKSNEHKILCSIYGFKFEGFAKFVDKLGCVSHSSTTSAEKAMDEAISLIKKGIENCPNRAHCLHVIFLASTPEGREELQQQEERIL